MEDVPTTRRGGGDSPIRGSNKKKMRLSVRVGQYKLRIPCTWMSDTMTIQWLMTETESRCEDILGLKPVVIAMQCDGALLAPSDDIWLILEDGDVVTAVIEKWIPGPLEDVYRKQCLKRRRPVDPTISSRLIKAAGTQVLDLSSTNGSWSRLEPLLWSLQGRDDVFSLDLSYNLLHNVNCAILAQCIESGCLSTLKELRLREIGLTTSSLSFIKVLQRLTGLCLIDLCYNSFGSSSHESTAIETQFLKALLSLLRTCPRIQEFRLRGCQVRFTDDLGRFLAEQLESAFQLKVFDISENFFTTTALDSCAESIAKSSSMAVVCLSYPQKIDSREDTTQERSLPRLKSLGLLLSSLGLKSSSIEEVSLRGVSFSTHDLSTLGQALRSSDCKLASLDIGESEVPEESRLQLLHSCCENTSLKSLSLQRIELSEAGARMLAELINNHPSLETLNISDCDLGLKGLQALCSFVWRIRSLKTLFLHSNIGTNVGGDEYEKICDSVKKLLSVAGSPLMQVDFSNNGMSSLNGLNVANCWTALRQSHYFICGGRELVLLQQESK